MTNKQLKVGALIAERDRLQAFVERYAKQHQTIAVSLPAGRGMLAVGFPKWQANKARLEIVETALFGRGVDLERECN